MIKTNQAEINTRYEHSIIFEHKADLKLNDTFDEI